MNTSETISKLRKEAGLSQTAFADLFGVSKQAVQKWEAGASLPSTDNLISMAEHFGVSLDALILGRDAGAAGTAAAIQPKPNYEKRDDWEDYPKNLMYDFRQARDEGKDVEKYRGLVEAVGAVPGVEFRERLADVVYEILMSAPRDPAYRYIEPDDLESIERVASHYEAKGVVPEGDLLFNKVYGAWVGRVAGCLLGKPLEGIPMKDIVPILKESGNYPLGHYLLASEITEDIIKRNGDYWVIRLPGGYVDHINDTMPGDDDTNYPVLALRIVEKHGRDFTPDDVAAEWVSGQPKTAYCTAERAAYLNFLRGYRPPVSALYKNPFREWIGAQIRVDFYGYICPGDPVAAARMAYRDATISHVKNGVYGAMFIAAMIAAAAGCSDMVEIIRTGLGVIPPKSRLHEAIEKVLEIRAEGKPFEKVLEYLTADRNDEDGYDWCHAVSNCIIVAGALLYGENDYGKSICLAVGSGFDTDCNGATVGSILGMALSIDGIGAQWKDPIRDKLRTAVGGCSVVSIRDCAQRTMKYIKTQEPSSASSKQISKKVNIKTYEE